MMRVRLKLKPGQRGTKRWVKQYGSRLFCVRYRYDEKAQKRYTTVEIIETVETWNPVVFKPDTIVRIKVAFDEIDLRQKIKDVGGRWSKTTKTWKLPYKTARILGLKKRIVLENKDKMKN